MSEGLNNLFAYRKNSIGPVFGIFTFNIDKGE